VDLPSSPPGRPPAAALWRRTAVSLEGRLLRSPVCEDVRSWSTS
jgi:hypothetical protein